MAVRRAQWKYNTECCFGNSKINCRKQDFLQLNFLLVVELPHTSSPLKNSLFSNCALYCMLIWMRVTIRVICQFWSQLESLKQRELFSSSADPVKKFSAIKSVIYIETMDLCEKKILPMIKYNAITIPFSGLWIAHKTHDLYLFT